MNAWLLTWEGTSGPALIPDKKIVAILSARKTYSRVADLVDLLYCRSVYSAYEMAFMANKRKQRDDQYKTIFSTLSHLFYGRNPCIYARVVNNLTIIKDDASTVECITWTEPSYVEVEKPGTMPVIIEPESNHKLVRRLDPLSNDVY